MRENEDLGITPKEISAAFESGPWADKFPPILTVDLAAELAAVPKQTIYDWSSRGLLKGCSRRVGKHLRILRDRFLFKLFNEGINS